MTDKIKTSKQEQSIIRGSWYEIGRQEGNAHRSIARYTACASLWYTASQYCHTGSSQDGRLLEQAVKQAESLLAKQFPEEWEKLRGVSEGTGIEMPLLIAVNFPQLIAVLSSKPNRISAEQGSHIMFPHSEWGPIMGCTYDHYENPLCFISNIRHQSGLGICYVARPALAMRLCGGMNSHGLAIFSTNSKSLACNDKMRLTYSAFDANKCRSDSRVIGRDMLWPENVILRSCKTVAESLQRMSLPDMWSGENYSIMDATGRGVQVLGYIGDSLQLRVVEMPADKGLCCGNFSAWEIKPDDFPLHPDKQDAFSRYASLQRTVDVNAGNYSVGLMKAALTSHEGDLSKGASVCNAGTAMAMIAAPKAGKLLFAPQPPCRQAFREYNTGGHAEC